MSKINKVVIMGGGSAGWLTAARLAAKFQHRREDIKITLVESPDVKTIGVGEGSWPSLRLTLSQIGVSEIDFINACQATLKQGSKFVAWKQGDNTEHYYHPFTNPQGYTELDLPSHWQQQFSHLPFAYAFCPQPAICDLGLAPKQVATPEFAQVANYGYHFDADKLANFLSKHCIKNLGVHYIQDHVQGVKSHENGDIASLIGKQNPTIEGDLFIDCSGMAARLIGKHYGINWHSVRSILPNDSAVALQVPYSSTNSDITSTKIPSSKIASTTIAKAQAHGWIWNIGLQHRKGVGLAYASEHCSQADAEETLLRDLRSEGNIKPESLDPRHIKFEPGYRTQFWQNNCVAIGMSSGFIEPLEASSLAMTELSINMLCDEFPKTTAHMKILAHRFNKRFKYRWERVIDFVKLHYILSERNDSSYWAAQRDPASIPDSLKTLMELWQYQAPSRLDFVENEEVFSSTSYQYILYGMGFNTEIATAPKDLQEKANALFQQNQQAQLRFIQALPENRAFLDAYLTH